MKKNAELCETVYPVFDIERFAIHDGPGIRTVVFLQGCPLKCEWCANPESQQIGRHVMQFERKCTGCGNCVLACPHGAVRIIFGKSRILREKCQTCGNCAAACLNEAIGMSGRQMNAREILDIVLRDRVYYESSGGGVTFSGGEALLYAKQLIPLWEGLCGENVTIALETCGHVPPENAELAAEYADVFLFDIKSLDREKFRRHTGGDLETVLRAFQTLCRRAAERVTVRVPVIPLFNDSEEELRRILAYAGESGVKQAELLPYHTLGVSKYGQLGMRYPYPVREGLNRETLLKYEKIGQRIGIEVTIA